MALTPIVNADMRGGQNNTDPELSLPMNQGPACVNVDWKDATLAHKRGGSTAVTETGGTAFTLGIQTLESHVPGADETARELWAIDGAAPPIWKRMAAGTSFANVTVDDPVATRPQDVGGAALNGKRFVAYDSTVDRLHVWDPGLATPRVRRAGFATPGVPVMSNVGAGSLAAVARYVRVRWLQITGSTVTRRSEPSTAVAFTPSGTGTHMRVTRPSNPGEGETHWEFEVSENNATWYTWYTYGAINGAVVIGTTFIDDASVNASYSLYGGAPDPVGFYAAPISAKYLLSDGNRLLLAGAWEVGQPSSRVWFTPVLGSADRGDDERIPNTTTQKNWVDLNEKDGGGITGLGGPINGVPYAFKYRQVWKLRPTGDVVTPYLPRKIRDDVGCIASKSIALGEDQTGRPALYFESHRGPYRITVDGEVEYVGRDNEVTWRAVNLAATTVVAHSVYIPEIHQWWLYVATGSSNDPAIKMMFDVQLGFPDEHGQIRGGWAQHTGDSCVARASTLMSNTLGASMSRDLKPYIGRAVGTAIQKADTTALDDAGTDFQAYVTTRPLLTTPDLLQKVGVRESTIVAKATAGSDVTVTINRDFGKETRSHTVSLAPAGAETRVVKKVEGSEMGEADVIQMTIGDSAANEEQWTIDALITPVYAQELR